MKRKLLDNLLSGIFLVAVIAVISVALEDPKALASTAAISTAIFAAMSAYGSYAASRYMQADHVAKTRPVVIVDFSIAANACIYYSIENVSNGLARNVSFNFDPAPIDAHNRPLNEIPLFQNTLATFSPGTKICSLFNFGPAVLKGTGPTQFDVTVKYEDNSGDKYTETFHIDFNKYEGSILPPKTLEELVEEMSKQLNELQKSISKVTQWDSLIIEDRSAFISRIYREAHNK